MNFDTAHLFEPQLIGGDLAAQEQIRKAAQDLADAIQATVPNSLQRDQAVLRVREACLLALDGLASGGKLSAADLLADHLVTNVIGPVQKANDAVVNKITLSSLDFADLLKLGRRLNFSPNNDRASLMQGFMGSFEGPPVGNIEVYCSREVQAGNYVVTSDDGPDVTVSSPSFLHRRRQAKG